MIFRFSGSSLLILAVSLLAVGCGSDTVPPADPLPKHVGDKLASDYQSAAESTEQALVDAEKNKREAARLAQDRAALKEAAESVAKTEGSGGDWLTLMKAIDQAIGAVSGDSEKPAIAVESLSAEHLDDLSKWFESLPEPAIAKLGEEDRRTPPAGAGWLWTLELRVDANDDEPTEKILTEFAETLRNSKLPDDLRLTHPVWKTSGENRAFTFVVRKL